MNRTLWQGFLGPVMILAAGLAYAGCKLDGEPKHKEHRIVTVGFKMDEGEPDSVVWRVEPEGKAHCEPTGSTLKFTAPPGTYTVRARGYKLVGGKVVARETTFSVTIEGAGGCPLPPRPAPPAPPAAPPGPKADPAGAIALLAVGNKGCTAVPIWPRRADGRWDILTASHCLDGKGSKGTITLQDGRRLPVTCVAWESAPDLAWLVTDAPVDMVPYAILAKEAPPKGTKIWQAGYGVTTRRARKDGVVTGPVTPQGKLPVRLYLSHGDSGGPFYHAVTGEVVGNACCTARVNAVASALGGACTVAWRMRPGAVWLGAPREPDPPRRLWPAPLPTLGE